MEEFGRAVWLIGPGERCRASGPSLRAPRRNKFEMATIVTFEIIIKEIYLKIQDSRRLVIAINI